MKGFVKISKYAGMREDLVQAGGGNSSYKISAEKMAIKASGYQLADITEQDGFALVNPVKIRSAFIEYKNLEDMTDEYSKKILKDAFIAGERPSIETFLHAISGTYTLHTHPIVVNALTCRKHWKEELLKIFPEALFVGYATPGVELAKAYFKAYRKYGIERIPQIVFLQNHGLIVSGESSDEVIERTEDVVKKIEQYINCYYEEYHNLTNVWHNFPDKIIWRVTDVNVLKMYFASKGMWSHTFCPDCVVFLGKKALNISDVYAVDEINKFRICYGEPVIVIYNDNLYIVADSVKKALEIQSVLSFSAQVMEINRGKEFELLSEQEQNFLLNWDSEKYRKNMK